MIFLIYLLSNYQMKTKLFLLLILLLNLSAWGNLMLHPIRFTLSTDKDSYYEGEIIKFNITITNSSPTNTYPVLLPYSQNTGQKLFSLQVYDKANNTSILRYKEDLTMQMIVDDLGQVGIKYLKPLEQVVIPIYLNDSINYYTQTASHHSLGVPLFASIYKVQVLYNPFGIDAADSIYDFDSSSKYDETITNKLQLSREGELSTSCILHIKRSNDSIVMIDRQPFYIKTDGYLYFYYYKPVTSIITGIECIHISNLLADSCSFPSREYFYSHFKDLYAEYVSRFDDGDIREYRKFSDYCPDYLYTEVYNEEKQKTLYALQLPDYRFYRVTYQQPSGKKIEESYCVSNGTRCVVMKYIYDEKGVYKKTETSLQEPCIEIELDGKIKSYKNHIELISK